jgi:hypothetical protein
MGGPQSDQSSSSFRPPCGAAGGGTLLVTSGGFADNPVPALASLSMGKAGLCSAQTLIAAGVRDHGIHAATVTIAGCCQAGTDFDPHHAVFRWGLGE